MHSVFILGVVLSLGSTTLGSPLTGVPGGDQTSSVTKSELRQSKTNVPSQVVEDSFPVNGVSCQLAKLVPGGTDWPYSHEDLIGAFKSVPKDKVTCLSKSSLCIAEGINFFQAASRQQISIIMRYQIVKDDAGQLVRKFFYSGSTAQMYPLGSKPFGPAQQCFPVVALGLEADKNSDTKLVTRDNLPSRILEETFPVKGIRCRTRMNSDSHDGLLYTAAQLITAFRKAPKAQIRCSPKEMTCTAQGLSVLPANHQLVSIALSYKFVEDRPGRLAREFSYAAVLGQVIVPGSVKAQYAFCFPVTE